MLRKERFLGASVEEALPTGRQYAERSIVRSSLLLEDELVLTQTNSDFCDLL